MECPLGKPLGFAPKRRKRETFFGLQPTVAMDKLLNKLIYLMVLKLIRYTNKVLNTNKHNGFYFSKEI